MEKKEKEPTPLHIVQQIKKREKLLQLYYYSGRPIFNQIRDDKHVFIEENYKTTGFYY